MRVFEIKSSYLLLMLGFSVRNDVLMYDDICKKKNNQNQSSLLKVLMQSFFTFHFIFVDILGLVHHLGDDV